MKTIRLMTTFGCNNNCKYCYVKSSPGYDNVKDVQLDKESIIKRIEEMTDVPGYELIGGEPFTALEYLEWFFEWNKNNGNKYITFFTSATINVDEVLALCAKYDTRFSFNVSYDGALSLRNKDNAELVKDNIKKIQEKYPCSVRWSVNHEDIGNILATYKELLGIGMINPVFFPMKYFDYTKADINLFDEQFNAMLDYCEQEKINFYNIFIGGQNITGTNKEKFECEDEITVLPDGTVTTCYVLYSSSEYNKELVYKTVKEHKKKGTAFSHERCKTCIDIFGACNKCPGNLIQYRNKTGNEIWDSYCDLTAVLAKTFIKRKLKINEDTVFEVTNLKGCHTRILNENGKVIKEERSEW